MTDGPALLELTGVSKRFGRITVADQLSLRFRPGELVGIVGPNGAGKTTLFAMIAGDVAPDAGDVVFDGRPLGRLDPASRCKLGIARTYQVPRPFENMTVFENLLVAAYRGGRLSRIEGYQIAAGILEQTGLSRHANTPAGRLGLLQRKRLELARGLATRPRVLLLDEVAGGLTDPEVVQLVDIVGQAQAQGITIVWVEHVVHALTRSVSHVICLAGGRLIAEGRPQDVLDNPQVKEVYLGADFRGDQGQIRSPSGEGQADIRTPSGEGQADIPSPSGGG